MLVKENLPVIIEHYPFHESLNEKILKETAEIPLKANSRNRDGGLSNVRALKSVINRISSPSIELIYEWILNLLRNPIYGGKFK